MKKIAIDAMGGDYAPLEIVKGAAEAARAFCVPVVLVGDGEQIAQVLKQEKEENNKLIEVCHASQVIGMDEHPGMAFRKKKDASVSVAAKLVKNGECGAMIAPGSTGAAVAAGLLGIGRIAGVERPAIITPIPNQKGGKTFLLDSGAGTQPTAETYLQNALLGYVFAKHVAHLERPRIGLLNIGSESIKGSPIVTEAYALLARQKLIPFAGNAEGRDVVTGDFDIIVTDGFTGNVVLKFGEGVGHLFSVLMKEAVRKGGLLGKIGGLLLKQPLREHLMKRMDYAEYGGAPLLGVKGGLIICHGASKAKAIKNAVRMASEVAEAGLSDIVAAAFCQMKKELDVHESEDAGKGK